MSIRTRKWTGHFDFLGLSIWLILGLGLAVISLIYFGVDFRGYYAAARVLMTGGNPYDYRQVAPVLLQLTGALGNNPYYYPPWFAWLFVPIAFLPYQIARGIWMGFNLVIWNLSLWKLSEILFWPQKGWRRYSLFILSTLTFAWITWRYEQASILVFAIFVLTILSIRDQEWNHAGILLALLLIKPNITLITVGMLCLWLIRKGQWRPVIVMLTTLIALLALSTWITPGWLQPFFAPGFFRGLTSALDGPDQIAGTRLNTTIFDWLAIFGIGGYFRLLIYGLVLISSLVILILTLYHSKSLLELISIALLISFVVTPYALQYDYAPLVIVLFWALSLCKTSFKARQGGMLLAILIFSVSVWQQNIAWGFWIVIGLAILVIWALYQKNQSIVLNMPLNN